MKASKKMATEGIVLVLFVILLGFFLREISKPGLELNQKINSFCSENLVEQKGFFFIYPTKYYCSGKEFICNQKKCWWVI